jgi:hypothetical protein
MDLKNFCVNQWIEFHDPEADVDHEQRHRNCQRPETFGTIVGSRHIKEEIEAFGWPQESSIEAIVVLMSNPCREVKIWFAGNGYMRMQCEMGTREKLANGQPTTAI